MCQQECDDVIMTSHEIFEKHASLNGLYLKGQNFQQEIISADKIFDRTKFLALKF